MREEDRQLQEEGMIVGHVPVYCGNGLMRGASRLLRRKTQGMDSVVTKPSRIPELMPEMDRRIGRGIKKADEVERSALHPLELFADGIGLEAGTCMKETGRRRNTRSSYFWVLQVQI